MTKMIKLSLVAAVAVAGFTTSAAAADLKDTTFSGKMEVEYDYKKDKTENTTENEYDLDLDVTAKTKLSDTWTSVVTVQADQASDVDDGNTNVAGVKNKANVDVVATYFQYANASTTVRIGRQGGLNATPYFDDERGDGALVLHTVAGVTLAAAHMDNVNNGTIANNAVNAAAIIGSAGPVNASLWFADVSNTFDAFTVNVNGKFGIVSVALTHTELDLDAATTDNSLTKLIVSAPVGPVTLTAGYAATDKEGGLVALNDDASAAFTLEQLSLNDTADSDAYLVGVSGTFGDVTASLTHLTGEINTNVDIDETLVKVSYPLAKSLKATAFYSVAEVANADKDKASIALEYKF